MPRVRRGAAAVLAAVAAPLLLSVLTAPPASAHDELVSVTPKKDAVLTTAPTEVVLVFSEEVEQLGATVVATSSDGTALADGAAVVDGPKVTQALLPIANATTVTVKYRIVSSDGHPVSGSWSFEVDIPTSLPPATPSASASAEASTSASSATGSATATDVAASPAASADDASSGSPWGWIALIAGLVALAVALVPISRRGRRA